MERVPIILTNEGECPHHRSGPNNAGHVRLRRSGKCCPIGMRRIKNLGFTYVVITDFRRERPQLHIISGTGNFLECKRWNMKVCRRSLEKERASARGILRNRTAPALRRRLHRLLIGHNRLSRTVAASHEAGLIVVALMCTYNKIKPTVRVT